jgi:hypothetical protein
VKLRKLEQFVEEAIPFAVQWIVHLFPKDNSLQEKMMNLQVV